jgi:RNA polymerase sigma factor FliA
MSSQPYAQKKRTNHASEPELEVLVSQFIPVIQVLAHRLARSLPACLDVDDLASVGVIGLMDALVKYDPGRGVQFKTYAEFRIRGAMLDEIRSMDWVPRSVRERAAMLQKVTRDLLQRQGRLPTDDDLAEALNISEGELRRVRANMRAPSIVSIEQLEGEALLEHRLQRHLADTGRPDPLSAAHTETLRRALQEAIGLLPERERRVLMMYYRDELTMKQISAILCVTECRICQIHGHAITRLRTHLTWAS